MTSINDTFDINQMTFKNFIIVEYEDKDGFFQFTVKPSELEDFKIKAKENINLVKAENYLSSSSFTKDEKGFWNLKPEKDVSRRFIIPDYFIDNGELIVKFGEVSINFENEKFLNSLKNMPTKFTPKDSNVKSVYESLDVTIKFENISLNDINEYIHKSVKLPVYEANEDKLNRWFDKEFNILALKHYDVVFFNWYINKHPNRNIEIYEYYKEIYDKSIEQIDFFTHIETPIGFEEWMGDKYLNTKKSIMTLKKFKL